MTDADDIIARLSGQAIPPRTSSLRFGSLDPSTPQFSPEAVFKVYDIPVRRVVAQNVWPERAVSDSVFDVVDYVRRELSREFHRAGGMWMTDLTSERVEHTYPRTWWQRLLRRPERSWVSITFTANGLGLDPDGIKEVR